MSPRPIRWRLFAACLPALLALPLATPAHAGGGPLGIDHEIALDQGGIWARRNQLGLEYGVVAVEFAGALWLGNDDALGHSLWQSIDASAFSSATAFVLKRAFGRARPNAGLGPDAWGRGSCCQSFPSGEVTLQAAFVTPLIVAHREAHPWVWALEALPAYDAVARMKSRAHWQTDVLAGWALGTAAGYWAASRRVPFFVQWMPHGLSVGYARRF
ncbi:MAG: phosphatase PAP2 family protein [Burkholderiales bacterium]|nr:phosphatase PAP2 family protein [Burkholderiales bacterium]MDE1929758.1 phosphatase PAP2 family protein [Burkholderiales bacterium]MDE2160605.1 phosphatase PAP2 family protein [Burkholderiales bacterium]MDE2502467.1 phosphatase PAP2 family protein [Burkholderiales bacterium]